MKSTKDIINENYEKHKGVHSSSAIYLKFLPNGMIKEIVAPFIMLGIADDGRAGFITEEKRLQKYPITSIGKNQLNVLADIRFWRKEYSFEDDKGSKKLSWDNAINDIIRNSQRRDFIESNIRGRGAWRDGDKLSYHDGVETYGEWDKKKIYLRLPHNDIGINEDPAEIETITKIKETVFELSFETPADAIKCLGWSVLAPFSGALKFRPSILLTGPSGSGKTTVSDLCIRKLAKCEWFNGSDSTVAGTRSKVKHDSCGIMYEESENKTKGNNYNSNRNELFSLMRVSFSNDAPDTVKGTKDGGFNSYKMQSMFGFIAIDPTIDNVADENRIFRINMVAPKNLNNWKSIENKLNGLLCEKTCRAIRALTWNKLKDIFKLSNKIVDIIREKTGRDYRSSYADAMLFSAFTIIWKGLDNPGDELLNKMLDAYYSHQKPDEHRNEAAEIIDRILDEQIEILDDGRREKLTVMECLTRINTGNRGEGIEAFILSDNTLQNYRYHIARMGIRILENNEIAFVNNHHIIKKIINYGNGYSKILKRHPGCVQEQKTVYFFDGKYRKCTIIKDLIIKIDKQDEIPF